MTTDRQQAVLRVLADRTGALNTVELARLVNSPHDEDDWPEIPTLTLGQVRAVAGQLTKRGLVAEAGYLNTIRSWTITSLGRHRVALLEGKS